MRLQCVLLIVMLMLGGALCDSQCSVHSKDGKHKIRLDLERFDSQRLDKLEAKVSMLLERMLKDDDWVIAERKFAYKLSPGKMTWEAADQYCRNMGASLAATGLREPSVRSFVYTDIIVTWDNAVWIGLDDRQKEGVWMWHDGVKSTPENTDWRSQEPDDWKGAEDCGHIRLDKMGDTGCGDSFRALCEMEL